MNQYYSFGWPNTPIPGQGSGFGSVGPQTPLFGPGQGQQGAQQNPGFPAGQNALQQTPGAIANSGLGQAVGSGVQNAIQSAVGTGAKNALDWIGGQQAAEHWKGIGLLALAVVAGIVGLMLWTGKGETAVKVSTSTGQRIATA